MTLKRVTEERVIILKKIIEGTAGKDGRDGKDGVTTVVKEVVHVQEPSEPGATGSAPEHEVSNGEIRFKHPDGTWGEWVSLHASGGGGLESVKYVKIETATYRITRSSLIVGTNIFGVNFSGDVEVLLPSGIDQNIIIVIKDESNNAGTNNITITTENS